MTYNPNMTPDENALASVLEKLAKARARVWSKRRDVTIAALEAERDVLAARVRAAKGAREPMSDEEIMNLRERAEASGDKRVALLCDAALDTWYFAPSTREWARRKLEAETPAKGER